MRIERVVGMIGTKIMPDELKMFSERRVIPGGQSKKIISYSFLSSFRIELNFVLEFLKLSSSKSRFL